MKAIVIISYKDKITGKILKKGNTIDVTQERFKEINSTAFGVFLAAKDEPKTVKISTEKPASKKK